MATPAEDRDRVPSGEAAPESGPKGPERADIAEIKSAIDGIIKQAQDKVRSIADAQKGILELVARYRGQLDTSQGARLTAILSESKSVLEQLKVKGAAVLADAELTPGVTVTELPSGAVRMGEEVITAEVVAPDRGERTEVPPSVVAAEELIRAAIERMQTGEQLTGDAVREVMAYVSRFKRIEKKTDRDRLGMLIDLFKERVKQVRAEGSPVTEDQIISSRDIPKGPSRAMREAQAVLDQWGVKPPEITLTMSPEIAALQQHIAEMRNRREKLAAGRPALIDEPFVNDPKDRFEDIDEEIRLAEEEIRQRSVPTAESVSDIPVLPPVVEEATERVPADALERFRDQLAVDEVRMEQGDLDPATWQQQLEDAISDMEDTDPRLSHATAAYWRLRDRLHPPAGDADEIPVTDDQIISSEEAATVPDAGGEPTMREVSDATVPDARTVPGTPPSIGEMPTMTRTGPEPTMRAAAIPPAEPTVMEATQRDAALAIEARKLLNIGKLRDRYQSDPEQLAKELQRAGYAERKGIFANAELRGQIETALRSLRLLPTETDVAAALAERNSAIEKIAGEVGLTPEQLAQILDRQDQSLRDRALQEIRAADAAQPAWKRWGGAGAKMAVYTSVGIGGTLLRIPGMSFLLGGTRMAENRYRGKRHEQKVEKRLAELRKELSGAESSDLLRQLLVSTAVDIATEKQLQIDGGPAPIDRTDATARGETYKREVMAYLEQAQPELSPGQRERMAYGAVALFAIGRNSEALTRAQEQRVPGWFDRAANAVGGKFLGSKVLRGGENAREQTVAAAVMAFAGLLAREMPIVRGFLFAYTGKMGGELFAMKRIRRTGRFKALDNPVTSEQLATIIHTPGGSADMINRARAQLMDSEFVQQHRTEAGIIRELLDRHEEELISRASRFADLIASRTGEMEQSLTARVRLKREREQIINRARIAGAVAGFLFGEVVGMVLESRAHEEGGGPVREPEPPPPSPERIDPELLALTQVHKGDGFTDLMVRQLYHRAHPDVSAQTILDMKQSDFPSDLRDAAMDIAKDKGFLGADGRTTIEGLRALQEGKRGGFVLNADNSVSRFGSVQEYAAGKVLGFSEPAPRVVGGAGVPGSVGAERMASGDAAAWEAELNRPPLSPIDIEFNAALRDVEDGGAIAREDPESSGVESGEAIAPPHPEDVLKGSVAAEEALAGAESDVSFPGEEVATEAAATAAERVSAFTSIEDVFRGNRTLPERIADLTAFLQNNPNVRLNNVTYRLGVGNVPQFSADGGTFGPVTERAMSAFVTNQKDMDEI